MPAIRCVSCMCSECKEYCTALVGQRTSLRDLSNTVLGLEEAVKDVSAATYL